MKKKSMIGIPKRRFIKFLFIQIKRIKTLEQS